MTITTASPNCSTRALQMPSQDHPLYPLFVQYNTLRELVVEADLTCERLAPAPSTLAEAHPAGLLAGHERDYYLRTKQKRDDYAHAAEMLHTALFASIDNLGGM